jgi:hypothetical protein
MQQPAAGNRQFNIHGSFAKPWSGLILASTPFDAKKMIARQKNMFRAGYR